MEGVEAARKTIYQTFTRENGILVINYIESSFFAGPVAADNKELKELNEYDYVRKTGRFGLSCWQPDNKSSKGGDHEYHRSTR